MCVWLILYDFLNSAVLIDGIIMSVVIVYGENKMCPIRLNLCVFLVRARCRILKSIDETRHTQRGTHFYVNDHTTRLVVRVNVFEMYISVVPRNFSRR